MKQTIKLTESELKRMIISAINEAREFDLEKDSDKDWEKGPYSFSGSKNKRTGQYRTASGRNFDLKKESIDRIIKETINDVLMGR